MFDSQLTTCFYIGLGLLDTQIILIIMILTMILELQKNQKRSAKRKEISPCHPLSLTSLCLCATWKATMFHFSVLSTIRTVNNVGAWIHQARKWKEPGWTMEQYQNAVRIVLWCILSLSIKFHCGLLNLFLLLSFSLRANQHFCLQKEANVPVFQGTLIANDTAGLDVSAALLRRSPRFWLALVLFCFLVEASL